MDDQRKEQNNAKVKTASSFSFLNAMLIGCSVLLMLLTIPLSLFFCLQSAMEYERVVVLRLGRLYGCRGPGLFFTLPCIDSLTRVDLRTVSMDVPPQEVLTRDSVTVSVDAVVFYRTSQPVWSVTHVENAHMSTRLLAQTTLRNMLGVRSLYEILTQRDLIVVSMQGLLDEATSYWGIKVERVEMYAQLRSKIRSSDLQDAIKDVRIPSNLQRAMAAEAEADREAKAKIVAAEGEKKASMALRAAAECIATEPAAVYLRYLQALDLVSADKNETIIFPFPIDLLKRLCVQS